MNVALYGNVVVEEHIHSDTRWVALRARGAEWSWITPDEAVVLARKLLERFEHHAGE